MLRQAPFYGSSFVSNSYVAPVTSFTNEWAYMDQTFSRDEVELTKDGFAPRQELSTYLWLADKRENPAYRRPQYYICIRPQALNIALSGNEKFLREVGCSDVPIVRNAVEGHQPYLKHRIVAADWDLPMYWAILELDWDFPPYLAPLEDDGSTAVRLELPADFQGEIRASVTPRTASKTGPEYFSDPLTVGGSASAADDRR